MGSGAGRTAPGHDQERGPGACLLPGGTPVTSTLWGPGAGSGSRIRPRWRRGLALGLDVGFAEPPARPERPKAPRCPVTPHSWHRLAANSGLWIPSPSLPPHGTTSNFHPLLVLNISEQPSPHKLSIQFLKNTGLPDSDQLEMPTLLFGSFCGWMKSYTLT